VGRSSAPCHRLSRVREVGLIPFKGPRRAAVALASCVLMSVGVLGGAVVSSLTLNGAPQELGDPGEVVVEVAMSEVDDSLRDWLAGNDAQRWASYTRGDPTLALPLSAVVWSPMATVAVRQCGLRLGASLAVGDTVLTPMPQVVRIAVTDALPPPPSGRTRLLAIGSVTAPMDESGAVADEEGLALLAATPEFAAWLDVADERPLSGEVRLDAPVLVGAVPPAAVIDAGSEACVIAPDGRTVPVRIVSSRLGLTLVVPASAGASLPARVVVDRDGSRRCGSN